MALRAPFHVLSLCSGIGGLDLGIRMALPFARTVCFVEREAYCVSILAARMADQALDEAPVWDDLANFRGGVWRRRVSLVAAGYPCQPFSVAGRRQGAADPRHLWPHVARVVSECAPEWCFFENVPGHLSLGFREVRDELQGMGFRVEAGLFSAAEVGAPHRRDRLFILAHAEEQPERERDDAPSALAREHPWPDPGRAGGSLGDSEPAQRGPDDATRRGSRPRRHGTGEAAGAAGEPGALLADSLRSSGQRRREPEDLASTCGGAEGTEAERKWGRYAPHGRCVSLADPESAVEDRRAGRRPETRPGVGRGSHSLASPPAGRDWLFPPGPGDAAGWRECLAADPALEPAICGDADGAAVRLDRLRALGNAVVPLVAAHALRTLLARFGEH